jgi:hypothetical protein
MKPLGIFSSRNETGSDRTVDSKIDKEKALFSAGDFRPIHSFSCWFASHGTLVLRERIVLISKGNSGEGDGTERQSGRHRHQD